MNTAFLPPASRLPLRRARFPSCRRRPQTRFQTPSCLAKFKQQETNETPESETPLEGIIPPPALPTLTTLTGETPLAPEPTETRDQLQQTEPGIDLSEISSQGAGISAADENQIASFLKGVGGEFALIEWPSAARVVRLTVIILATLLIAISGLYFVDGFFYRMANILFEGKI